ncbi:Chloride channel [Elusimicrobium minutum Pei191]|uniref:Chloride channel n=1 Tax=Elusimicrobium minutum (strain Pei191) TaxID=445932 RepID=B2KDW6_ELUMP|nr:chloride channel protein [Elusimicrobium minutum]ACC98712.1 Chloride channel [Elusimicrobium minutum Pei191]
MFKDQRGVFLNIIKWFILSTAIGAIVGVAAAAFLFILDHSISTTTSFPFYYVGLPFVFILTSFLSKRVFPKDTDFSTDAAINKINAYKPISLISAAKAFFLPVLTISAGGSAGKEAPCADVGAGLASFSARLLKLSNEDRRKLMICGVSAGFAGVFGVPISGAIFGLEVLWVGYIFYEVMFPALVAGITAYQVTSALGVTYIYHPIPVVPVFTEGFFLKILFAGLFFGLISLLFIEIMKLFRVVFRYISIKFSFFWKAFTGGAILVAVGLLLSPEFLGLGMEETNAILHGSAEPSFALGSLFKMITTAITFSAGGVGGIVTPIFFIGSQAGAVLGEFLQIDPATVAALGVVAVLAGATNAPLASSIMAIELFGPQIAPYAAVCCVISFLVTGQRSVFAKQRVSFDKTISDPELAVSHTHRKRMPVKKASFLKLAKHLIPQEENQHKYVKRKKESGNSSAAAEKTGEKEISKSIFKHLMPKFKEQEQNVDKDEKK